MKKVRFLIMIPLLFSLWTQSEAQTPFKFTASNSTGAILNTSIDTLSLTLSRSYHTVSVQPIVTKATGTMAGTAILAISVNGVNFVNTDTLTLANAAINSIIWNKITAARYLRVIIGGATTVTGTGIARVSASD